MQKIALSGKIGSGKTTIAQYLASHYAAETFSFAKKLKSNLEIIGVAHDALYHTKPPLVRELMQIYGQVMRQQDADWWVREVIDDVRRYDDGYTPVAVIDDLRFKNEAILLQREGFTLVRVTCTDDQHNDYVDTDVSEVDLDDWSPWDFEIEAKRGDIHTLISQVDSMINTLQ